MFKNFIISNAISLLMSFFTKDLVKDFINKILDFCENKIVGSASKIDDKFVLPLMENLRAALAIQDKDGTFANVPSPTTAIGSHVLSALVGLLDPKLLTELLDSLFDFVENFVLGTKSTVDDALVLPVISTLRVALNVPDNDEEPSTAATAS